ncbi:MAG: hypothetical protein F6J95_023870 [Leptolyngbya sp. SIO1E4]|nr:hypothetical protein [Leptolyngbya sp. SIO1E4]
MGDAMAADRNQVTITLSDKAMEEYTLVAQWLGMPRNTLIRQIVEEHHQSPSFGNLVRRARSGGQSPESLKFPIDD